MWACVRAGVAVCLDCNRSKIHNDDGDRPNPTTTKATNLESAFFLCQMFYPQLRKTRGAVVNISSISGQTSDGTGVLYHMTKAALDHMTRLVGGLLQSPLLLLRFAAAVN